MYPTKLFKILYQAGMRPTNAKDAFVEVNRCKLKAILVTRAKIPPSSPNLVMYRNVEAHTIAPRIGPRG